METAEELEKRMVGTGRFELPTPRTPSECSTRLSHVPTWKDFAKCHEPRSAKGFLIMLHQPPPAWRLKLHCGCLVLGVIDVAATDVRFSFRPDGIEVSCPVGHRFRVVAIGMIETSRRLVVAIRSRLGHDLL